MWNVDVNVNVKSEWRFSDRLKIDSETFKKIDSVAEGLFGPTQHRLFQLKTESKLTLARRAVSRRAQHRHALGRSFLDRITIDSCSKSHVWTESKSTVARKDVQGPTQHRLLLGGPCSDGLKIGTYSEGFFFGTESQSTLSSRAVWAKLLVPKRLHQSFVPDSFVGLAHPVLHF